MAQDGKLPLPRNSLGAFIDGLEPGDRFEELTFNVQPNPLFTRLEQVDATTRDRAAAFLASQAGRGGTVLNAALSTAYRYADPDRALNVVILSDGLTEQNEWQTLLEMIRTRPRNARVFCIGVGNEVNRPLLEQLAQDSGGLAAFLSQGDNIERAALAFRRKLMRPVATEIGVAVEGVEVYDVEPVQIPNLYNGYPVRIYGRYRGEGAGTVRLTAHVQGQEFGRTAVLDFPARDSANPELERMWAWKRIDRLLKDADRSGSRDSVANEVVALGEKYSIVTEYTSFLVLENDAEYQRWQIERRNLDRLQRDRASQEAVSTQLAKLREKAQMALGPGALAPATATPTQTAATPQPTSSPSNGQPGQSVDFNFGTGPVGPLFVAAAAWLRRRRQRTNH